MSSVGELISGEGRPILPVIMCGGSGSRLWPVSRPSLPKQYHSFIGERTLLQDTVMRVRGPGFGTPLLVCNEDHRFVAAEQVASLKASVRPLVLEPVGRNTAPVAVVASLVAAEEDPEALILLLPADHLVQDAAAFQALVADAVPAARAGSLCLFGIQPTRPETGYGYIEISGDPLPTTDSPVRRVESFVEKPDAERAARMIGTGRYAWNSGIFLFQAGALLREAAEHLPDVLSLAREALGGATRETDFVRLASEPFGRMPSVSIDVGIMERTRHAAVLPAGLAWSDLGAWDAVHAAHPGDADGNVLLGRAVSVDSRNTLVRSDERLVAAVGVENLVIVATDDAVLVVDRSRAQDVKRVLERLRDDGQQEALSHVTAHRPWGSYRPVVQGERFQVKLIKVKPGGRLSLQVHHHRAEHWIVVRGTARITCGERVSTLYENQSTYIPQGDVHRLENPGRIPLEMIEVQSGSYLGEDDIVRFEDVYGRVEA